MAAVSRAYKTRNPFFLVFEGMSTIGPLYAGFGLFFLFFAGDFFTEEAAWTQLRALALIMILLGLVAYLAKLSSELQISFVGPLVSGPTFQFAVNVAQAAVLVSLVLVIAPLFESSNSRNAISIGAVMLGAIGIGSGLYRYLGGVTSGHSLSTGRDDYRGDVGRDVDVDLRARVESLERSYYDFLVASSSSKSKDIDIDALIKSVEEKALEQMPDKIGDALAKRFAEKAIEESQINSLRLGVDQSRTRLRDQVEASVRRSNLNLIIGILTTALAAGILGFVTLFETKPDFVEMTHLLAHYIPRISTIIFIEVFAFFFLRLYKAGIQETRYFQNELTSIESRAAAIEGALIKGQTDGTRDIIRQLVRTDRNNSRLLDGEEKAGDFDIKTLTPVVEALAKVSGKAS